MAGWRVNGRGCGTVSVRVCVPSAVRPPGSCNTHFDTTRSTCLGSVLFSASRIRLPVPSVLPPHPPTHSTIPQGTRTSNLWRLTFFFMGVGFFYPCHFVSRAGKTLLVCVHNIHSRHNMLIEWSSRSHCISCDFEYKAPVLQGSGAHVTDANIAGHRTSTVFWQLLEITSVHVRDCLYESIHGCHS